MFPGFERVMGNSMSLERNMEQHHIFQPVLQEILAYSAETRPVNYQAAVLQHLIEAMAPSFHQHLRQEIMNLVAMETFNDPALLKVYKSCEAEAGKQNKVKYLS